MATFTAEIVTENSANASTHYCLCEITENGSMKNLYRSKRIVWVMGVNLLATLLSVGTTIERSVDMKNLKNLLNAALWTALAMVAQGAMAGTMR
jgi:hypothetical protein